MASDPRSAALALHRFGFGPRGDTIRAIAGDPRGALAAELQKPNIARVTARGLESTGVIARVLFGPAEVAAAPAAKPRTAPQAAARRTAAPTQRKPGMRNVMTASADP